jgi:hypothetical protein
MDKSILYPHILKAEQLSIDKDWKDIMHSCACGKFPKGIRYDNSKSTLHIRYKNENRINTEVITLSTDPQKCHNTLLYVFKDLLLLRSSLDVSTSKKELETMRVKNSVNLDCEWKKLKPKSVKNYILMNFAISQVKKHGMTGSKDAMKLNRLIQLGFQFRQLISDDVRYNNGVISSISGVKFNASDDSENDFPFYLSHPQGPIPKNDKSPAKINYLDKSIDKWAKDYQIYGLI